MYCCWVICAFSWPPSWPLRKIDKETHDAMQIAGGTKTPPRFSYSTTTENKAQ